MSAAAPERKNAEQTSNVVGRLRAGARESRDSRDSRDSTSGAATSEVALDVSVVIRQRLGEQLVYELSPTTATAIGRRALRIARLQRRGPRTSATLDAPNAPALARSVVAGSVTH